MMTDFGTMLREHGFHAPHVTPAGLQDALEKHGVQQKKVMEEMFEKYVQMSSSKVLPLLVAMGGVPIGGPKEQKRRRIRALFLVTFHYQQK